MHMDTMAPTRTVVRHPRRISLAARPTAAAKAREHVRGAIRAWEIPVDPHVAALLTSELVTNAITHEEGETVTLVIMCACDQLRVVVHDTSSAIPVQVDAPADAEAGRGLMLVSSLSSDWGFYRTAPGKAVYFTLAFTDERAEAGNNGSQQLRSDAG
jgi:anti-sigma regulatory factor (Ser/Thr protein kinase)